MRHGATENMQWTRKPVAPMRLSDDIRRRGARAPTSVGAGKIAAVAGGKVERTSALAPFASTSRESVTWKESSRRRVSVKIPGRVRGRFRAGVSALTGPRSWHKNGAQGQPMHPRDRANGGRRIIGGE